MLCLPLILFQKTPFPLIKHDLIIMTSPGLSREKWCSAINQFISQ
jgi:hypothetical protein